MKNSENILITILKIITVPSLILLFIFYEPARKLLFGILYFQFITFKFLFWSTLIIGGIGLLVKIIITGIRNM